MTRWLVAALVAASACKGRANPADNPPPAARVVVDWQACEAALRQAALDPLDARPLRVIDGCRVCGDWAPLLRWNTPRTEGGPTIPAIEAAMVACDAFCDPNAKQRFVGTLDTSRGMPVRTPWRLLGEACKERVSAVPDVRYMSAPYFALDRIARAASQHGGELATLVSALELPLPAVSLTGAGALLPEVQTAAVPKAGELAVTLLGGQIFVGKLPRARLGASGVVALVAPTPYPGVQVTVAELGAALAKLAAGDQTLTITLVAPYAMPAQDLVPVVAAASKVAPIYLAANAPGAPEGWDLPGTIPVALVAGGEGAIAITPEMSVQDLAAAVAKRRAGHVGITGLRAR